MGERGDLARVYVDVGVGRSHPSALSVYHPLRPQLFLTLPPHFFSSHLIATRSETIQTTMSRLIIRNLPPYLTLDALRKH